MGRKKYDLYTDTHKKKYRSGPSKKVVIIALLCIVAVIIGVAFIPGVVGLYDGDYEGDNNGIEFVIEDGQVTEFSFDIEYEDGRPGKVTYRREGGLGPIIFGRFSFKISGIRVNGMIFGGQISGNVEFTEESSYNPTAFDYVAEK